MNSNGLRHFWHQQTRHNSWTLNFHEVVNTTICSCEHGKHDLILRHHDIQWKQQHVFQTYSPVLCVYLGVWTYAQAYLVEKWNSIFCFILLYPMLRYMLFGIWPPCHYAFVGSCATNLPAVWIICWSCIALYDISFPYTKHLL